MAALQPFDPMSLVWIGLLNPAVIGVGFVMGRTADQWQKLIVAAFAAALAGFGLVWLAVFVSLLPLRGMGGEAGLFVIQFVLGLGWSALGFLTRRDHQGVH